MTRAIFLSASVPDPKRDPKYFKSADLTAIRDAVRALVSVVLPRGRLVWGGHPAITPLIKVVAEDMRIARSERVRLFQSNFFRGTMPVENAAFQTVIKVPAVKGDLEASLQRLRRRMLESEKFSAGIFIGGMEHVEAEYSLFRELHPRAKVLPIASTGGAALLIFQQIPDLPTDLRDDLAYPSLFRRLLNLPIVANPGGRTRQRSVKPLRGD